MRTRMHSSRMHTARCSGHLSFHACPHHPCHAHHLPCMPPATHTTCHACPPAMHTTCHACPPVTHAIRHLKRTVRVHQQKSSMTFSEKEECCDFHCQQVVMLLPPAMKLGQGNIFRSMCQGFCPWGCLPYYMLGYIPRGQRQTPLPQSRPPRADPLQEQTPPGSRHPLEQTSPTTVHAGIWSTSGWYGSYWNAYLFCHFVIEVGHG